MTQTLNDKKPSLKERIEKIQTVSASQSGYLLQQESEEMYSIIQALVDRLGKAEEGLKFASGRCWPEVEVFIDETLKSISLEEME